MQNKQKKTNAILNEQNHVVKRKPEDLQLMQNLLAPELFVKTGSDEHLDRLLFESKLKGEKELEIEDYTLADFAEYHSRFYIKFYYGIAKMHGIDKAKMDTYVKPFCAKYFTLNFIYARFPQKVLNALMSKRKSDGISGIGNKLHQYLSAIALHMLELFIDQADKMMDECDNITDFKLKYSKEYNLYFQIDMFTDAGIIS